MTTLNLACGESGDDGNHDLVFAATDITLADASVGDNLGYEDLGLRFPGVSGLSGATINTATLTFRATATDSGTFTGDWFAHDTASPAVFGTGDTAITGLTRTTATCEGDNGDFGNWTSGNNHTFTGDGTNTIADIIQELADSYDPSAIALLWIFTFGSGERVAAAWDHASAPAPKLDIDYTAGGGGGSILPFVAGELGNMDNMRGMR